MELAEVVRETRFREAKGAEEEERHGSRAVVSLNMQPAETLAVADLMLHQRSSVDDFDKVTIILASLCDEIYELKRIAETDFYCALCGFGARGDGRVAADAAEMLGYAMMLFQEVSAFAARCRAICKNLVRQLHTLYASESFPSFKDVHLVCVFESLAELLKTLVTMDAIIRFNHAIAESWKAYKELFSSVMAGTVSLDASSEWNDADHERFEAMLISLEHSVFSGRLFLNCVEQDFELPVDGSGRKALLKELIACLNLGLSDLQAELKLAGQSTEAVVSYECEKKIAGLIGLYVLYTRLLPPNMSPDVHIYKRLWGFQKTIPIVSLFGAVHWFIDDFLTETVPFFSQSPSSSTSSAPGANTSSSKAKGKSSPDPKDGSRFRKEYLTRLDASLGKELRRCKKDVLRWLVSIEQFVAPLEQKQEKEELLLTAQSHRILIYGGLALAQQLQRLLLSVLNLHVAEQVPMSRRNVLKPLSVCIELLKMIQNAVAAKLPRIAILSSLRLSKLVDNIRADVRLWMNRLSVQGRSSDVKYNEVRRSLQVFDYTLTHSHSLSRTRLILLRLGLNVLSAQSFCKPDEIVSVENKITRIEALCDWQMRLNMACDCTVLYWHPEVLSVMLSDAFASHLNADAIPLILQGFNDAGQMLQASCHLSEPSRDELVAEFSGRLRSALQDTVITPLCREIEVALRLHQHSCHLQHMKHAAVPKRSKVRPLRRFLDLAPIQVFDDIIDIRDSVQAYLEKEFYNMTVLSLHDWNTYGEMRSIAYQNYGLILAKTRLPQGTLDMGLDILQIMRNIHVFVSMYNYNLNQQYFIERKPDRGAKHLNTINISSIAKSIRTHGAGMINTCVNYTYQFLSKKFYVFSQFLFDDHIKSYLSREIRWFNTHASDPDVNHRYPFHRAFEFNKDIRRLGQTKTGLSFLGQFRVVMTEIGNALGYIRMVRSAGMHRVAEAIQFVPDLEHIKALSSLLQEIGGEADVEGENCGPSSAGDEKKQSGRVDQVVTELAKKFAEGTDYLKVLVDVFQGVMLNSPGSKHLENFYMIVPALSINFTESSLLAKDNLSKAHKGKEAYFTDDGFAIGLAYVLGILKQGDALDSLHWFESVEQKYTIEIKELKAEISQREVQLAERKLNAKGSFYSRLRSKQTGTLNDAELTAEADLISEEKLRGKRLQKSLKEYRMLTFALSGARSFLCQEEGLD